MKKLIILLLLIIIHSSMILNAKTLKNLEDLQLLITAEAARKSGIDTITNFLDAKVDIGFYTIKTAPLQFHKKLGRD